MATMIYFSMQQMQALLSIKLIGYQLMVYILQEQNYPSLMINLADSQVKNHHRHLTTMDLHQYFRFHTLKNTTHFKTVSQPTVTIFPAGSTPKAIGNVTTINHHTSNKSPVLRLDNFFDAAHMDITYGDLVSPRGIKFALIVVDYKSRYTYVLPLRNCQSSMIIQALQQLKLMAGKLPKTLYTDFDPKLLSSTVLFYCAESNYMIIAAPADQQNPNSLVKTYLAISVCHGQSLYQ